MLPGLPPYKVGNPEKVIAMRPTAQGQHKRLSHVDDLSRRPVPAELWKLTRPLIPGFARRPQGGGTSAVDDRAVFTAIVFVLTGGCAWRMSASLPVIATPVFVRSTRFQPGRNTTGRIHLGGLATSSSGHPDKDGVSRFTPLP